MSTEHEALDCPLPPGSRAVVVPPEGSEEREALARSLASVVDDARKIEQAAGRLRFRDRYTPFVVEVEAILRALTGGDNRG